MKKYRKVIGIITIAVGITILFIPNIITILNTSIQEQILEEYKASIAQIEVQLDETTVVPFNSKDAKNSTSIDGILSIPKIDLEVPLLIGASKEHLNSSISSVIKNQKPWMDGNYVLAGHRSITYGRLFNRLDELKIGDQVYILDTKNVNHRYVVYDKYIVQQEETSVLNTNGFSEITLITCHPANVKHPTTRLIVKAKEIH